MKRQRLGIISFLVSNFLFLILDAQPAVGQLRNAVRPMNEAANVASNTNVMAIQNGRNVGLLPSATNYIVISPALVGDPISHTFEPLRPVDPPGYGPGIPIEKKLRCLGDPPCAQLTGVQMEAFFKSRLRPMLIQDAIYQNERSRFALNGGECLNLPSPQAYPSALDRSLSNCWLDLQTIGKSVGKILIESGNGTGIYVGNRRLITNKHVADGVNSQSMVKWSSGDSVAIERVTWRSPDCDLAIILLSQNPSSTPNARDYIEFEKISFETNSHVGALGYPRRFTDMNDCLTERTLGRLGNLRISPGVIRGLLAGKSVPHDSATDDGSSGSPIMDLKTSKIIGFQTGYSQQLNLFCPVFGCLTKEQIDE